MKTCNDCIHKSICYWAKSPLSSNADKCEDFKAEKTGHWKFVQRGRYIDICCSNCGFQRVKEYAYNYTVDQISEQDIKDFFSNSNMNFCENCGVKMEGEEQT